MATSNQPELNDAREAISKGDKIKAQQILAGILRQDGQNVEAWLLLSDILENPEQRTDCLKRVLQINPNNVIAKRRLADLMGATNTVSTRQTEKPSLPPIQSTPISKPMSPKKKNNSLVVLAIIAIIVCGCVGVTAVVFRQMISNPAPTSTPITLNKPLSGIALNGSDLQYYLNLITPLQAVSPQAVSSQSACSSEALACFTSSYTGSDGDLVLLELARFASQDQAENFGIGMLTTSKQSQYATELNIPTTAGNYRWLVEGYVSGSPVFTGGAAESGVAIMIIWGRTSIPISQDEATQAFGRLLDAQITRIKQSVGK